MPDPKLKTAVAEIEAILAKHDVAGVVLLSSTTHLEYLLELSPSWSCCRWEQHPEGKVLRIKALRADYPSKEAHDLVLKDTVGLIMGFLDGTRGLTANLESVAAKLAEKMDFQHYTQEEPRKPDHSGN